MSYDQAIQRAEQLIVQLEQAGPIGAEEYRLKAQEIKSLLDMCEEKLRDMNYAYS
ncbi:MAG: hypothetical protein IJT35_04465 [Paludibacteraceae bacterium]|nr:hypothetical protein [Paludibacteraceae bacterium]